MRNSTQLDGNIKSRIADANNCDRFVLEAAIIFVRMRVRNAATVELLT